MASLMMLEEDDVLNLPVATATRVEEAQLAPTSTTTTTTTTTTTSSPAFIPTPSDGVAKKNTSSPERLKKHRRQSSVTEISQMSPEKLAKYMQRYEKLSTEETFYAKYQIFYRQAKRVHVHFTDDNWRLFQKSQYKICLKTKMSPVGIFMYTESVSKYDAKYYKSTLETLKTKISPTVVIPVEVKKWLEMNIF